MTDKHLDSDKEVAPSLDIELLISCWSMRPQPGTPAGQAWESGARQGWQWALEEAAKVCNAEIDSQDSASTVLALKSAAIKIRARIPKPTGGNDG